MKSFGRGFAYRRRCKSRLSRDPGSTGSLVFFYLLSRVFALDPYKRKRGKRERERETYRDLLLVLPFPSALRLFSDDQTQGRCYERFIGVSRRKKKGREKEKKSLEDNLYHKPFSMKNCQYQWIYN